MYHFFYADSQLGLDFITCCLPGLSVIPQNGLEQKKHISGSKLSVFDYAVKTYDHPKDQRDQIRKDNKSKSGVYAWVNNTNNKIYIGSGCILYTRISNYYQQSYYKARPSVYILRALIKYGIENFTLVILAYTDTDSLLSCEQKWIDLFRPEYNLSPIAGNTKGYKHTQESIDKIREATLGRHHTEEVKREMSKSRMGKNNSFFGKTHSEAALDLIRSAALNREKPSVPGLAIEILDLQTKLITSYDSVRKAAKALSCVPSAILYSLNNPGAKAYKGRYKFFTTPKT